MQNANDFFWDYISLTYSTIIHFILVRAFDFRREQKKMKKIVDKLLVACHKHTPETVAIARNLEGILIVTAFKEHFFSSNM